MERVALLVGFIVAGTILNRIILGLLNARGLAIDPIRNPKLAMLRYFFVPSFGCMALYLMAVIVSFGLFLVRHY